MDKKIFAKSHTRQNKGVCVLHSYAVAASAHIDSPVQDYLEAYCRARGQIVSGTPAEEVVANNWDVDAQAGKRSGYQHLAHVHSTFIEKPFSTASAKVSLKPIAGGNTIEELKAALKTNPNATAVLALHGREASAHSVAIAYDEADETIVISDPNSQHVQTVHISAFTGFNDNGTPIEIGEALLLEPY